MTGKLRNHLRSNVVGYLALFVALSGTAWAATSLDKNEVKSKHIGKGQVKAGDLASDSVTSPKVADGSLLDDDFAPGQLPAGPRGEQGPQGERGPEGLRGPAGATNIQVRTENSAPGTTANTTEVATPSCLPGERVTGGGIQTFNHDSFADSRMVRSNPVPSNPPSWDAAVFFTVTDPDAFMTGYIVCAAP